ncbi:MAG: pyruvate kinase [Candidatus Nanopelagicales bacterium]|nr:pyruvate kinase [Candidatus Nanopelagicales bacterium]
MRRAKIVCTLGPATSDYDAVRGLVECGMDVARLNLSHGTYEQQEATYRNVRRASEETGRGVGILVDLQGPKIRLGVFADGPVALARGARFVITTQDELGDESGCSTTYAGLPQDVKPDDLILVDDGRVTLRVTSIDGPRVVTQVVEPGVVSDHKGLNLPGVVVSAPALTDKDAADLRWALRTGADMIALSFVREASDIDALHRIMEEEGCRVPVLAKIEKPQAIARLDQIVERFDGVMVARGDLGVELALERVPLEQKRAIDLCRRLGKPVIVATQMLESMVTASRPTRAEVSDVANAVLDGADALMLSEETSVGKDPALVVRTMARIIQHVEEHALDRLPEMPQESIVSTARAVTRAAVEVGQAVDAAFLIAFTETGSTARLMARHRAAVPLLAYTPNPRVRHWLALVWGVEAFLAPQAADTDALVDEVDAALLGSGRASGGELVVIVAGVPPGVPGTTNGMRVHPVGRTS